VSISSNFLSFSHKTKPWCKLQKTCNFSILANDYCINQFYVLSASPHSRTAEGDGAVLPDDVRITGEAPRSVSDTAGVAAVVASSGYVSVREHPSVSQRVRVGCLLIPTLAGAVSRRVRTRAPVLRRLSRQTTLWQPHRNRPLYKLARVCLSVTQKMITNKQINKKQINLSTGGMAPRSYSPRGSAQLTVWLQFLIACFWGLGPKSVFSWHPRWDVVKLRNCTCEITSTCKSSNTFSKRGIMWETNRQTTLRKMCRNSRNRMQWQIFRLAILQLWVW